MSDFVSNSDDIIDSRDVIAAIEELESDILDALNLEDEDREYDADLFDDIEAVGPLAESVEMVDKFTDLCELLDLQEEAQGSPDWSYGETLIRDSYFEEYARELAEDIGAINSDASWPNNCIDWEQAANDLQMDYMSVDFAGVEYWIRA